ncbi:MAG: hypothetical protein SangKO_075620 [Sandaracinaceae bacterium]
MISRGRIIQALGHDYGKLTEQLNIRIDDETAQLLEAVGQMVEEGVGLRISRVDVVRALLRLSLEEGCADDESGAA